MIKVERLLLIGGTGREAGKSSLAILLISKFAYRMVNGIKITPHTHPDISGLVFVTGNETFRIYEEKNTGSEKDSSRMLKAGAAKVLLVVSSEAYLEEAFSCLQPLLLPGAPVICESPALRRYVEPDLFVLMKHPHLEGMGKKDISDLIPLVNLNLTFKDLEHNKADIIDLDADNKWYLKI